MATKVPFGTMLAFAALVASLFGEPLLTWYFVESVTPLFRFGTFSAVARLFPSLYRVDSYGR